MMEPDTATASVAAGRSVCGVQVTDPVLQVGRCGVCAPQRVPAHRLRHRRAENFAAVGMTVQIRDVRVHPGQLQPAIRPAADE